LDIGLGVAAKRGRILKGRADFIARTINGTELRIDPDDDPPRHANIVNWPAEKSDRLLLAIGIAAEARLQLLPER
jgi:hypothetical protein